MKQKKKLMFLLAFIISISTVTSCSNEVETLDKPITKEYSALSLYVGINSWMGSSTRATYSNLVESNGYKKFPTTFDNGDAIGIYIVDKSGNVTVSNLKCTFNGSSWELETPVKYEAGMGSYSYYAYYPFKENITGSHAVGENVGKLSDVDFFSSVIDNWIPESDQSTKANFTSSDLMTSKGTANMPLFQEVHITFVMHHRMGLLVTKSKLSYYDEDNTSDTWTVTQSFTTNVPYAIGEELYYIAKPDQETMLGSKTATVGSGEVEQLYFPNGEPSSR